MQFYIVLNGQAAGPFDEGQVRGMLAAGQVGPDTLCCPVGGSEWRPLGSTLAGGAPAGMPMVPYAGPSPYAVAAPTNSLAITSLVLGCAALACCGVTSLPAVICGHIALGQIKRSGNAQTGRGLALTGLVLGYVMIAAAALYFLFIVGLGLLGAANSANR